MTTRRVRSVEELANAKSLARDGSVLALARVRKRRPRARAAGRIESGKHALDRERVLYTVVLLMVVSGSAVGCSNDTNEPSPQGLPAIQSISPFDAVAGSSDLTITVTGAGFLGTGPISTQVVWHTTDTTTDLTTTVVDSVQLTAVVPAALLFDTVVAQVHVETRDRVEGVLLRKSNDVAFAVVPAPAHLVTLDSISPTSAVAGSPDLTLSLAGSGFRGKPHNRSAVEWSTKDSVTELATTFVDSTRITAIVPAALLRDTVVAHVYLLTGDVMGDLPLDHSNILEFTVTPAPPD